MVSTKGFKPNTSLIQVAYINSNIFPNKGFNSNKQVNKSIHESLSITGEGRKQGFL
jgi:hypothetical protein